jgi:uncharacterized protein DUF6577
MFTTDDLVNFYLRLHPKITRTTINWRVHELVNMNIIARVGRGKFAWGSTSEFTPILSDKVKEINKFLKERFPLVNFCIWQSNVVKSFEHHISKDNFILLDVEREVAETVSNILRLKYNEVFYRPSKALQDDYIIDLDTPVIVRHLISAAPTQIVENVNTITIEKMAVDIFSDQEFFHYWGYEMVRIYRNIFELCTVNVSKLLRYADRKGKKEEITDLIRKKELAMI